jgi:hypothetical protein
MEEVMTRNNVYGPPPRLVTHDTSNPQAATYQL